MKYYTEEEINNIIAHVKKYTIHKQANNVRPALSLIFTLLGFFASIFLCHYSVDGIIFVICFNLRLFVIFHDCCHGCFFNKSARHKINCNAAVAQCIEQFVLDRRAVWVNNHSHHHSSSGNVNYYDHTRTVISLMRYSSLSFYKALLYNFLRTPVVFFILGPFYIFFILNFKEPLLILKLGILYLAISYFGGFFLLENYIIGVYITAILGLILIHLQHQVNPGYWQDFDKSDRLSYYRAQLHGSSYLWVPFFLRWVTYGIEYHHIHHVSTQVPCYLLKRCQDEGAELFYKNPRVGCWQAFRSLFHTLYDEEQGRYISFPLARWLGLQA